MSTSTLLLIAAGVALFFGRNAKPATVFKVPVQRWGGGGVDPFGSSYTVTGRAARGGL